MDKHFSLYPPHSAASFRYSKTLCTRGMTIVTIPKSYAQVDPKVVPQLVLPRGRASAMPKQEASKHKRPAPLSVRFSEIERNIVGMKAKTVGCSLNAYVRASALGSHYKPPYDPVLRQALLDLNRELTAHGNNLNQIAKHLNSNAINPAQGESLMKELMGALLRTLAAVRKALGHGGTPL